MLNLDPAKGDISYKTDDPTAMDSGANPFPGLRPFSMHDSPLYFGRQKQVREVIEKLKKHHFVAVLGYSGSGKSSLILAGVIPSLYHSAENGELQVLLTRPGIDPISNLSEVLLYSNDQPFGLSVSKTSLIDQLNASPDALLNAILNVRPSGTKQTVLIIDQFEELFRLEREEANRGQVNQFVKLILAACERKDSNIYVAITMRSDQIGYSARLEHLTEYINQSNYLIPQMSNSEKKEAITGPILHYDGSVSDRLVDKVISDLSRNQDQLPVMQHALMRTWDYWIRTREEGEPMDLRHYHSVGETKEALSLHANEAYDELNSAQKEIAEILFKSLTEKGQDNVGMRRPARLGNIADQTGASVDEVIFVAEKFREHGRSFLMPPPSVPLSADSILEISHESLMRIWDRLRQWVEEEYESAQMYRRISEAAAMYQVGQTGLWRPPDLQLALNWQKKQRPTYEWAKRYDETFERAMVFLETSRITFETEQKHQELYQKRLLKRTRVVAFVLGFAAVVSILFFIFAILAYLKANEQRDEAIRQKAIADQERQKAEENEAKAKEQEEIALASEAEAHKQESIAREKEAEARENLEEAERQRRRAEEQALIAHQQRNIADEKRGEAEAAKADALTQYERAETNFKEAQDLLYRSIAQSMAVKSLRVEDDALQGLLAQQAYAFNERYHGKRYEPYIYNGLFSALQSLKGKDFNSMQGILRNSARTVALSSDQKTIFSTGSQGKIVMVSLNKSFEPVTVYKNNYPNRVLRLSSDDQYLVNGSDSTDIQVFDLLNSEDPMHRISGHQKYVNDIHFMADGRSFISIGGDRQVRRNSLVTMTSDLITTTPEEMKSFVLSKDQNSIYGGTVSGKVLKVDLTTGNTTTLLTLEGLPIHALNLSPDNQLLVVGDERGSLHIISLPSGIRIRELKLHKARVTDVAFSANGQLLATSSLDGSLVLWETNKWNEIPIQMSENDAYVWDIAFSQDGNNLVAACGDGDLRIWPTRPDLMAGEICTYIKRNMTNMEWEAYVGNDIPFESTCSSVSTQSE